MHDSALDELCRKRPGSIPELLGISGFGEYKAALYGPRIFEALQQFRNGVRAAALPRGGDKAAPDHGGPVVYDGGSRSRLLYIPIGVPPEVKHEHYFCSD